MHLHVLRIVISFEGDCMKKIFSKKERKILSTQLLEQYFKVDGKKLIADLYFDTFSELVEQNIGDDTVEKLNGTLFDKLTEIFELIPSKYEITVNVHIRDFGNYSLEEAEKIIKNNIGLKVYSYTLERRRKKILRLSLFGGGVALLLASYFMGELNLPQIFFDVINISGTLLVWESADITLIERGVDAKNAIQYVKKFKGINLMQA